MSQKVLSLNEKQAKKAKIQTLEELKNELPEPAFTPNALEILEKRYLHKDGDLDETAKDLLIRVAWTIASIEKEYGTSEAEILDISKKFYEAMARLEFFPNSPTLRGAGRKIHQLAACFVIPIDDSMEGIFDALKTTALVHKGGGGTGFSFGRLRPSGDQVGSTGGVAGGPLSFMSIFDTMAREVMQGGVRVGANMGILPVWHPDIEKWIYAKADGTSFLNFNLSVAATDDFMNKIEENGEFELRNPRTKKTVGTLKAGDVFQEIIDNAWKNGDPGIIFIDKMNADNPTPELGEIESTNPCVTGETLISTEQGLIPIKDIAKNYAKGGLNIVVDMAAKSFGLPGTKLPEKIKRHSATKTISRAFPTGTKECFKITTKSGYELTATADHKPLTEEGYKEVKDLKVGDKLYIQPAKGSFNPESSLPFSIKNEYRGKNGRQYCLNLPTKWSKILGETLGYLVGDGWLIDQGKDCRVGLTFGQSDLKTLKYFQQFLNDLYGQSIEPVERENGVWHLSYHSQYLVDFFGKLGVQSAKAGHKDVPLSILTAPEEAVIGFLRGLFSSDGTVRSNPKSASEWLALTAKSRKLLQTVQLLLLNLGIKSQIMDRSRPEQVKFSYTTKAGENKAYACDGVLYELGIFGENLDLFAQKINFIQKEKQQKLAAIRARERRPVNFLEEVINIEPAGKLPVYNLTEPETHSMIANGIVTRQCGEQPLLPHESCNLGSINLARFVENKKINFDRLGRVVHLAVRFMDNVIDANRYFVPEIEKMTKGNRKIGLGVMGFADMLAEMEVAYNSDEAIGLAEKVMKFIRDEGVKESELLAKTRGPFPHTPKSIFKGKTPRRNATITTIAPTGTLSLLGGCAGGIEPMFALVIRKKSLWRQDGTAALEQIYVNPIFERLAREDGFYSEALMAKIAEKASIQDLEEIPEKIRKIFPTAHDIAPEWHIKMQAAFQKYTDNAVSKTINFPHSATADDIKNAYLLAYKLNCKGLTVYRDGSRSTQVLSTGATKEAGKETQVVTASAEIKITPRERPDIIRGFTYRLKTAYGKLFITVNDDEHGAPFEVFSHLGKAGGFFAAKAEAICRLISLALRSGVDPEEIIDQLKGIRGPTPTWGEDGKMVLSLPDAIAQILEKHLNKAQANLNLDFKTAEQPKLETLEPQVKPAKALSLADLGEAPACPECGAMLEIAEGCLKCNLCGYSKCG